MPAVITDDFHTTPQTSYGAQKAIGELLIPDYSRKGYVDGRCLRLPTIVVRPGAPNKAAATFASSIVREPLTGRKTVCPLPPDTGVYILSPRLVTAALLQAMHLPERIWPVARTLLLPGITVIVAEMAAALARAAGPDAADRIQWRPDPHIQRIVAGSPTAAMSRTAAPKSATA